MNHDIDEQFELLNHLLGEGTFGQNETHLGHAEQRDESASSMDSAAQKSPQSAFTERSSVIETRPDTGRERRKGTPEVIFGATKETAQIVAMAQALLGSTGRAIISRLRIESVEPLQKAFQGYTVRFHEASRAMVIYSPDYERKTTGGHVGVISAGTSDIPAAEEAALIAEEMGCHITSIYDVGVAGLHRLVGPLRELIVNGVDVIIVAAGMDGALPSVVTGLVPVPVIGLPTSIGYGLGGKGVAALLSMLQTCAPGLSVVNIDNGVGAGITAALIANRVAFAREHQSQ
ncbi:MAG: nickel pincer cofactor biosynthesis protein LarB [Ktedonobacteraceae bacterium]